LAKSQLAGSTDAADKATITPPSPPPPAASRSESSSLVPVAILSLAALGGTAYYFDLFNLTQQGEDIIVVEEVEKAVKEEEPVAKEETAKTPSVTKDASGKADEKVTALTVSKEPAKAGGSRVTSVQVPTKTTSTPAKAPSPKAHPAKGNRVAMAPPPSKEASAVEAAKELEVASLEETSATLAKARQSLRADIDQSLFADLDSLSTEQLKIRVVQLATEMEERTKWEAVRLKEFLAMKEKETAEK
jgi:mitofilin